MFEQWKEWYIVGGVGAFVLILVGAYTTSGALPTVFLGYGAAFLATGIGIGVYWERGKEEEGEEGTSPPPFEGREGIRRVDEEGEWEEGDWEEEVVPVPPPSGNMVRGRGRGRRG